MKTWKKAYRVLETAGFVSTTMFGYDKRIRMRSRLLICRASFREVPL